MNKLCDNNCQLCFAIENSESSESHLENTLLYETKNFSVLPSVGPLVVGQILIVSKNHFPSLASMSKFDLEEFRELLYILVEKTDANLLFSEHGTFNSDKGGGCIDHTHIHVIPHMEKYIDILDAILPRYEAINNLSDFVLLKEVDFPYIMNINSYGTVKVYEAYNTHSQIVRKAICAKESRTDWNWRLYEKSHFLVETINFWKSYFEKD